MIRMSKGLTIGRQDGGPDRMVAYNNQETAYAPLMDSGLGGLPVGSSMGAIAPTAMQLPLLDGFLADHPLITNRIYREMYAYDPIIASAVDMLSTFPFGEFSLTGLNDERRLLKYAECVEMLRLRQLLPTLSVDYLTLGKFVGTLQWDSRRNIYSGICPHNVDFLQIEALPIHGAEPTVRLSMPPEILKLLNNDNEQTQRLRRRLPEQIMKASGKGIVLDPDSLIYIARSAGTGDVQGTPLLKRLLSVWLMEKALIRGTLDQFWKRQRAILHITMGEEGIWEPSEADYNAVNELFLNADHDPTGAIVVTRGSIMPNEVRRGDDFLKYPDIFEWATQAKLRGLGISDSFLAGDSTQTATEGAVNVMMQNFSAYRSHLTQNLFYDKIFPGIAVANNFKRTQNVVLGSTGEKLGGDLAPGLRYRSWSQEYVAEFAADQPKRLYDEDQSKLAMPRVHWHTPLNSERSSDNLEMLSTLESKGVPIPLRVWAAATGQTLEDLAEQRDADLKTRKFFEPWRKEIMKMVQEAGGDMGGGDGGETASIGESIPVPAGEGSTGPRRSLLDRNFEGSGLETRQEVKGKPRSLSQKGKKLVDEKVNRLLAEAASSLNKRNRLKADQQYREAREAAGGRRYYYSARKPG